MSGDAVAHFLDRIEAAGDPLEHVRLETRRGRIESR